MDVWGYFPCGVPSLWFLPYGSYLLSPFFSRAMRITWHRFCVSVPNVSAVPVDACVSGWTEQVFSYHRHTLALTASQSFAFREWTGRETPTCWRQTLPLTSSALARNASVSSLLVRNASVARKYRSCRVSTVQEQRIHDTSLQSNTKCDV